jgi:hypothetical protein
MPGNFGGGGAYAFLAIMTICIAQFLRIYRWKLMVYKEGEISNRILSRSIGISYLANLLLPFRLGELARIYYLKRKKFGLFPTTFAVILERLLDSILLTIIFMVYFLSKNEGPYDFLILSVISTFALSVVLYLFIKPREQKLKILKYFSDDFQLILTHIILQIYLVFSRVKMNFMPIISFSILINVGIFFSIVFFSTALSTDISQISQILLFDLSNSLSMTLIKLATISSQAHISIMYLLLPILFMIVPSFREIKTRNIDVTKIELDKTRNLVLPVTNTSNNDEYIKLAVSNIASSGINGLSRIQMETLRGEKLIEVLQGGSSGDQVFLIEKNGIETVRKSASDARSNFLLEQNKWMRENYDRLPIVSTSSCETTQNAAFYDMEYLGKASGLFEWLHSNRVDESKFMMDELLQKMNTRSSPTHSNNLVNSYSDVYAHKIQKCYGVLESMNLQKHLDEPREHEGKDLLSASFETVMDFLSGRYLPAPTSWLLHGDLTVSNMLVNKGKIQLIDPNPIQPFFHPTVDFGKLLQSFKCGYEFDFKNIKLVMSGTNTKILNTRSLVYAEMEDFLYSWIESHGHPDDIHHARIQLFLHLIRIIPYAEDSDQIFWVIFHMRIVFTELNSI